MSAPNVFLTTTKDQAISNENNNNINNKDISPIVPKVSNNSSSNINNTNSIYSTPTSFLPTITKQTIKRNKPQYIANYAPKTNTLSKSQSDTGGMFHYFKSNLDIMREEADDIINSLQRVRARQNVNFYQKHHSPNNQHSPTKNPKPSHTSSNYKPHSRQVPSFNNSSTTSPLLSNSVLKPKDNRRTRKFIVFPIELKKLVGFYPKLDIVQYTKGVVANLQFQKTYITDELNVFIDNYQYFKQKYPPRLLIHDLFPILTIPSQQRINTILEEITTLIMEIPYLMLGNFYNNVIDFIGRAPPVLDKYHTEKADNEVWCLKQNIQLLATVFSFLQSCLEMYLDLFSEVTPNELLISYDNFNIAKGYLERMRYDLNTIIEVIEMHIKNYTSDKKTIQKMESAVLGKYYEESPSKKTGEKSIKNIMAGILNTRSGINEKIFRLNSVLNVNKGNSSNTSGNSGGMNDQEKDDKERYEKHEKYDCPRLKELRKHKSLLESPLINELYQYFDKSIQEKILALKSHQQKI